MHRAWLYASLLFVALALAPAAAHVLQLPNKIGLPSADYLTVQQLYRGWALLAIVVVAALVATAGLLIVRWHAGQPVTAAALAFLCVAGAQVVFWVWTQPVNKETDNWTRLPAAWTALRAQWEYSHAAGAALTLLALLALIHLATADRVAAAS